MRACWSTAAVLPVPYDWAALLVGASSCPHSVPRQLGHCLQPCSVRLCATWQHRLQIQSCTSCAVGYPVKEKVQQGCILSMKTFSMLWSVTPCRIPHLCMTGTISRLQKWTYSLLPLTSIMFAFCIFALQSYIMYSSCHKANWHVLCFLIKIEKL